MTDALHPPHATQTCGLCAVGLPQVEALGLVEVFDLALWIGCAKFLILAELKSS